MLLFVLVDVHWEARYRSRGSIELRTELSARHRRDGDSLDLVNR